MAVNNTSAPAVTPVSLPIGPTSFSVHNVGVVMSSASEKSSQQIVYQPVVNKPVQVSTALPITQPDSINRAKLQSSSPPISSANTVTVAMPQKQVASKVPQVITSRSTQPSKTFGVHPINSRSSVSVLSHMVPRLTQATATTPLGDPGGGYLAKTLPGQTSIIQASVKPAKVAAQHVLMAPGLRTPAPIKLPTSYPPIYHPLPAYHIHGSMPTSNIGHKPSVAFTTAPRVQVRPLASHNNRTTVSLANSTNSDIVRRSSNVVYQPTTTISISVPARPNHQPDYVHNQAERTNSAAGGKPMYQVGIAPLSTTSTSSFTPKVQRMVVGTAPASFSVIPTVSSRNVTTTTAVTSASAFTYSAPTIRLAPITSIATTNTTLPLSKVYPPQGTRIHTLQPSVSGISAHVRTTDLHQLTSSSRQPLSIAVTTTQSSIAMPTTVTSLTTTRATSQPVMPMMYWPNPLNLNSSGYPTNPSTYQGTAIRPTINVPVTTPSLIGTQIRIPSAVLVMEPPRLNTQTSISTYSQGQVLQSVVASQRVGTGTEHGSLHQPHVATTQPPGGPHMTNMSPKPTILRRPARPNEGFPNKKLSFNSEPQPRQIKTSEHSVVDNTQNSAPAKIRYLSHELYHPSIAGMKPALPGQVPFHKPATSNGLIQTTKVQVNNTIKDYSTTNYIKLGGDKEQSSSIHVGRYTQQTIGDVKSKSDPVFQRHPAQIKAETASSHLAQHQYNLSYHQPSNKSRDVNIVSQQPHRTVIHNMAQPANKVRHLQQRGGMLTVATPPSRLASYHVQHSASSTSIGNATVLRQIPPNMAQNYRGDNLLLGGVKTEPDLSSANLKRDYDKMNTAGGQEQRPIKLEADSRLVFNSLHLAGQEMVGLSPRKKPRKQTHVIAEDVADQEALEEMSTDDADECEDEPNINTPNPDIKPFELPSKKRELPPLPPTPPPTTPPTSTPKPPPEKMLKEYTDDEGVRYVHVKERPITLLNGLRLRQVHNHFTHYSDVKVKADKKPSFHDPCFDPGKLKAWKVPQLAQQLTELAQLDSEALSRIERIKNGLLQFCQTVLPSANGHDASGQMSPGHVMSIPSPSTPCPTATPTSALSASFGKSFSPACPGSLNSPKTPLEKKAGKFKDEILKIEEMAQANIQRCNVMQEQLAESKTSLLKIFDHRSFANNVVNAGRKIQKNNKAATNGSRSSKKKKS